MNHEWVPVLLLVWIAVLVTLHVLFGVDAGHR